jgi:hemoglobin
MKIHRSLVALTLVASAFAGGTLTAGAQQAASAPSLYTQLGGYDAIAAVTDDLIGRLATDPKLTQFFVGLNDQHKAVLRQHFVEFLCAKTGGPCIYTGQDMKAAHAGLKITQDQWDAALADFRMTEDKFNIAPALRSQLAVFLDSIKADIVTGP